MINIEKLNLKFTRVQNFVKIEDKINEIIEKIDLFESNFLDWVKILDDKIKNLEDAQSPQGNADKEAHSNECDVGVAPRENLSSMQSVAKEDADTNMSER